MLKPWLLTTAFRYIFTKRSAFWIILISVIGITLGIAILIVILSIMNGSQMIYYENSQELLSYHVRVDSSTDYVESHQFARRLREEIPESVSVNLFYEAQGMLVNSRGKQLAMMIRGVEPDIMELDPRMKQFISMKSGTFDLYEPNTIVLGSDMARALSVSTGSEITFFSLSGGTKESSEELTVKFTVAGIYETDWSLGVDSLLAFVSIESRDVVAADLPWKMGLKLHKNTRDQRVVSAIEQMPLPSEWSVSSWRDYNKAFFGALRMEKTVMMLLVVLIFLVFAVNTYNGLSRLIYDKQEELGILRAMGATPYEVRYIFILQGLFIAIAGALLGTFLGFLIVVNLEVIKNFSTLVKDEFLYQFFPETGYSYHWNGSSFNKPRIMLGDLVRINLLAVFISLTAAFLASIRIGRVKPAEVLRYE